MSNRVGFLLKSREDREIVRAAALNCGLDLVELGHPINEPAPCGPDGRAASGMQSRSGLWTDLPPLLMIITDDPCLAQQSLLQDGQSFPGYASPLILQVQQAKDDPGVQSDGNSNAIQDAACIWALSHPLSVESVTSQLQQTAHLSRVFSERHRKMLEEVHRWRRIFDSTSNGISICDANALDIPLVYVNPAFERLTGYTADEACGRSCRFLQGNDTDQPGLTLIREAIRDRRDVHALLKNYRKDGSLFWNELYLSPILDIEGRLTHFVGIQNDVTLQVESTHRLDYLARHDELTGLVNRGLLMELLKQAMQRARRSGGEIAVLFFDLDNFKNVNDVLGHDAGDRLLQLLAGRLRAGTRAGEVVARLGGDEFVVVLEYLSDDRQPKDVMQRLIRGICERIDLFDQEFYPAASVGMSIFPRDGDTPELLLKLADRNMYIAKYESRTESLRGWGLPPGPGVNPAIHKEAQSR